MEVMSDSTRASISMTTTTAPMNWPACTILAMTGGHAHAAVDVGRQHAAVLGRRRDIA